MGDRVPMSATLQLVVAHLEPPRALVPALDAGHLVMQAVQLRRLKRRVEALARSAPGQR